MVDTITLRCCYIPRKEKCPGALTPGHFCGIGNACSVLSAQQIYSLEGRANKMSHCVSIVDYPEENMYIPVAYAALGVNGFNRCLSGKNRTGNLSAVAAGLPDEKDCMQT